MSTLTQVVAAIIHLDGKYFIAQRPLHKNHGGLWEFPGGKVQQEELLEEAIIRELREELNLIVDIVGQQLGRITEEKIAIHFLDVSVTGQMLLREHQDARWCTPAELLDLPLCPIDERFVREILNA